MSRHALPEIVVSAALVLALSGAAAGALSQVAQGHPHGAGGGVQLSLDCDRDGVTLTGLGSGPTGRLELRNLAEACRAGNRSVQILLADGGAVTAPLSPAAGIDEDEDVELDLPYALDLSEVVGALILPAPLAG